MSAGLAIAPDIDKALGVTVELESAGDTDTAIPPPGLDIERFAVNVPVAVSTVRTPYAAAMCPPLVFHWSSYNSMYVGGVVTFV